MSSCITTRIISINRIIIRIGIEVNARIKPLRVFANKPPFLRAIIPRPVIITSSAVILPPGVLEPAGTAAGGVEDTAECPVAHGLQRAAVVARYRADAGERVLVKQIGMAFAVRAGQIPRHQFVHAGPPKVFFFQHPGAVHRFQMFAFQEVVQAAQCAAFSGDAVVHRVVGVGFAAQGLQSAFGVPGQGFGVEAGLGGEAAFGVEAVAGFDVGAGGAADADVLQPICAGDVVVVAGAAVDGEAARGVGFAVAGLVVAEGLVLKCAGVAGGEQPVFRVVCVGGGTGISAAAVGLGEDVAGAVSCVFAVDNLRPGGVELGEFGQLPAGVVLVEAFGPGAHQPGEQAARRVELVVDLQVVGVVEADQAVGVVVGEGAAAALIRGFGEQVAGLVVAKAHAVDPAFEI